MNLCRQALVGTVCLLKRGARDTETSNSRGSTAAQQGAPCLDGADAHLTGAPARQRRRRGGGWLPGRARRSPRPGPAASPATPGRGPKPPFTRRRRLPTLDPEGRYQARAHPPPEVGGRRTGRTDLTDTSPLPPEL
jgi:hypothetical protein